jgi:cysteine desulfurase
MNGSVKHRLPNNLHITIPGKDNERLLIALDNRGIYAASGSACSASHEEPSHVLAAMGIKEEDIKSSIRFSLGRQTTQSELAKVVKVLREVLA